MENKLSCGQVNIPQVDNSVNCDDFITSECIIIKQLCSKIGNKEGENLDKFIELLCFKISKMDNQIFNLKKEIESLKTQIENVQ